MAHQWLGRYLSPDQSCAQGRQPRPRHQLLRPPRGLGRGAAAGAGAGGRLAPPPAGAGGRQAARAGLAGRPRPGRLVELGFKI